MKKVNKFKTEQTEIEQTNKLDQQIVETEQTLVKTEQIVSTSPVVPKSPVVEIEQASTESPTVESTLKNKTSKLLDVDKAALDLAKSKKEFAAAQAAKFAAQSETAEIYYRYTVLQLYLKYKLSEVDGIEEDSGNILYGAHLKQK